MLNDPNKAYKAINRAHEFINKTLEISADETFNLPKHTPAYSYEQLWNILREIQAILIQAED